MRCGRSDTTSHNRGNDLPRSNAVVEATVVSNNKRRVASAPGVDGPIVSMPTAVIITRLVSWQHTHGDATRTPVVRYL